LKEGGPCSQTTGQGLEGSRVRNGGNKKNERRRNTLKKKENGDCVRGSLKGEEDGKTTKFAETPADQKGCGAPRGFTLPRNQRKKKRGHTWLQKWDRGQYEAGSALPRETRRGHEDKKVLEKEKL